MAGSKAFRIAIVGDIKDASKALQSMEKRSKKFGGSLKKIGAGIVAGFAIGEITDQIGSAIDRAEEMGSLYAATETIVANMGDRVGKTADEIKTANAELSRMTGIDKAAITESTNVLLTFGNIGEDAFNRAQSAVLDMSTVFGGDASSAATQLGKALNDPVAGIGALSRVGVQFTEDQKEMIESLVEAGDVAGAQAIILGELEGQVGGTAVATADASDKLKNMGKDAQEWIGNKLLPVIEKAAAFMVDEVIPAFRKVADWIRKHVPPWYEQYVKPVMESIQELITAVREFVRAFWDRWGDKIMRILKAWWGIVSRYVGFVLDVFKGIIKFLTGVFTGDWGKAWEGIKDILGAFVSFFRDIPAKIARFVGEILGAVVELGLEIGKGLVNGIIRAWNAVDFGFKVGPWPSWVPLIGGKSFGVDDILPDLPYLAKGGIVTSPTLAMVGEAGPEAVVPLGRGMGNVYNITVETGVGDPVVIGRAVVDAIDRYEQVAGSSWRAS